VFDAVQRNSSSAFRRDDVPDHARAFIDKYGPLEKLSRPFAAKAEHTQKKHF
jgi:hypothetical protein